MTIAALDIGTNTLLLLIARIENGSMIVLADEHRIARLGEGVDRNGLISPGAVQRAVQIVEHYSALAEMHGAEIRRAVGTSVFRSAVNAADVAAVLAARWGSPIEILTGEKEAELCFRGTVPPEAHTAGVLDIGGGSTELIVGTEAQILFRRSIDVGAVRIAERYWQTHPAPAHVIEQCRQYLHAQLGVFQQQRSLDQLYAVAGTPTTLALIAKQLPHFDPTAIDGYILHRDTLNQLWSQIAGATVEQLRSMPGVHPGRADILPAGTLILRTVMDIINVEAVTASIRGLRYGLVLDTYRQLKQQTIA